jgi:ribose/xylose/arabinose/galactoside ABC-type transport system permease subunit
MNMNIKFIKMKELPILLVLIAISITITIVNPSFASVENLLSLLKSNLTLAIMSLGMLVVILTGGIDVSVASVITAVTFIVGNFLNKVSSNLFLTIAAACLSGTLAGFLNGCLVARLRIPPIVATLGTMSIVQGLVLYITGGKWIINLPDNFVAFGKVSLFQVTLDNGRHVGFPVQGLMLIAAAALTWFILKRTIIGRGLYAIGGNLESAERIGFKSKRILAFAYAYCGALVGLAAVSHTSIMQNVDPNAFLGFEMQVIAAVVLGGASTTGGVGSVLGTLLGVAIFCVINNGLILMKIPTFWQKIAVGVIIIVSISIDMLQKTRTERRQVRVDVE